MPADYAPIAGVVMISMTPKLIAITCLALSLQACGLYVPSKDPFKSDVADASTKFSSQQALYESNIVGHIYCELATGLYKAKTHLQLPWLSTWGTAVTLTITAQDQSALSPGVSFVTPMANVIRKFSTGPVTSPQSFSFGLGGGASANATRTETIQFTYLNSELLQNADQIKSCKDEQQGIGIDGDLKIADFIYDKGSINYIGNATTRHPSNWPIYNTLTDEVNFVSIFGGSATPTWKLVDITANTASSLLAAQRTYTNDLIITIGPVKNGPSAREAAQLSTAAQAQHNTKVQASAIATANRAQ